MVIILRSCHMYRESINLMAEVACFFCLAGFFCCLAKSSGGYFIPCTTYSIKEDKFSHFSGCERERELVEAQLAVLEKNRNRLSLLDSHYVGERGSDGPRYVCFWWCIVCIKPYSEMVRLRSPLLPSG